MAEFYFDSSAFAKRYVSELGSTWVQSLVTPRARHTIFTVWITGAEIVAALARRARVGTIAAGSVAAAIARFKRDFRSRYQLIAASEALIESAMALAERHGLRGYDSVQLAAALELHTVQRRLSLPAITFVSADRQLNTVATAEGLAVETPDDHP